MANDKKSTKAASDTAKSKMSDAEFLERLEPLQVALVTTQQWLMETGAKVLIIFEGRDAAGKDGTIKRMIEHMSARSTRVVALPKPSDRERTQWHFQRYAAHLPAAGEVVIFNRSWYNRGGVEPVMGFCTPEEHADFLRDVVPFETMLSESGTHIIKLWLDISREEQARRLEERRTDPLARLKISLPMPSRRKSGMIIPLRATKCSKPPIPRAPLGIASVPTPKSTPVSPSSATSCTNSPAQNWKAKCPRRRASCCSNSRPRRLRKGDWRIEGTFGTLS